MAFDAVQADLMGGRGDRPSGHGKEAAGAQEREAGLKTDFTVTAQRGLEN